MLLSKWTHTSLADILEMETEDFWQWFRTAYSVENEIAKELKVK